MTVREEFETLNNRELLSVLAKVALPIALQSLIGSSLSLIDNLMVGSLGEVELNAVGVSVQIFFIHWMLLYGFAGGSATFISQFFRRPRFQKHKKDYRLCSHGGDGHRSVVFYCRIFLSGADTAHIHQVSGGHRNGRGVRQDRGFHVPHAVGDAAVHGGPEGYAAVGPAAHSKRYGAGDKYVPQLGLHIRQSGSAEARRGRSGSGNGHSQTAGKC